MLHWQAVADKKENCFVIVLDISRALAYKKGCIVIDNYRDFSFFQYNCLPRRGVMKRVLVLVVLAVACGALIVGCAQQKKPVAKAGAALQRIHFDFDKSNIKPEYEPVLRGNAQWMQEHAKTAVTVEGHCDERGSIEYNIALGDRRASSAKGYMVNLGVADSRFKTVSYGEERPLCTEHNESCWWQNRRAEFIAQ